MPLATKHHFDLFFDKQILFLFFALHRLDTFLPQSTVHKHREVQPAIPGMKTTSTAKDAQQSRKSPIKWGQISCQESNLAGFQLPSSPPPTANGMEAWAVGIVQDSPPRIEPFGQPIVKMRITMIYIYIYIFIYSLDIICIYAFLISYHIINTLYSTK